MNFWERSNQAKVIRKVWQFLMLRCNTFYDACSLLQLWTLALQVCFNKYLSFFYFSLGKREAVDDVALSTPSVSCTWQQFPFIAFVGGIKSTRQMWILLLTVRSRLWALKMFLQSIGLPLRQPGTLMADWPFVRCEEWVIHCVRWLAWEQGFPVGGLGLYFGYVLYQESKLFYFHYQDGFKTHEQIISDGLWLFCHHYIRK